VILIAVLCAGLSPTASSKAGSRSQSGSQEHELTDVPTGVLTIVYKTPRELAETFTQLEGLEPAADQKDLPMILKKVGQSVQDYFHNFVSTSAAEEVVQQRLRPNNKVQESFKQKFQYLLVASPEKGELDLEEYRMDKKGRRTKQEVLPGGALTSGFASMPAHFHPSLQDESRFSYVGTQKVNGCETWVVAFSQKPEVARYREKMGDLTSIYVVFLEGLAWIDNANFQIVRMHTELLPDMVVRSVQRQDTDINFKEVHFAGIPVVFWLPQEVVVFTELTDKNLRNIHRYSNYRLYTSQTKIITDEAPQ
jgi:hypothetical protein